MVNRSCFFFSCGSFDKIISKVQQTWMKLKALNTPKDFVILGPIMLDPENSQRLACNIACGVGVLGALYINWNKFIR